MSRSRRRFGAGGTCPIQLHVRSVEQTGREMKRMTQMRSQRGRVALAVALAVTLTAALGDSGFLAASSVAGNARASATVSLAKTKLGMVLVNSRGHTLYLFAKDRN